EPPTHALRMREKAAKLACICLFFLILLSHLVASLFNGRDKGDQTAQLDLEGPGAESLGARIQGRWGHAPAQDVSNQARGHRLRGYSARGHQARYARGGCRFPHSEPSG